MPMLTYGFGVMDVKKEALEIVMSFHHRSVKVVQGLPGRAVNFGSLVTIGWKPIDMFTDQLRLMFLWRILLSNIYKTLLIRRLFYQVQNFNKQACGPVRNVLDIYIK